MYINIVITLYIDRCLLTTLTAAAAAKLLQSCPTLCDPIDGSPPGFPILGILQPRTLEWVAISFSNAWKWKVKVKSLSRVRLSATPWTAAFQAPPSMGFSRQEYWSGVPLPSPPLSNSKYNFISILKEISPEYSLKGLMLKLKLQYFGHLIQRIDSLEKTQMMGKIEGGERRGQQRMRWLDGITNTMDMSLGELQDRQAWRAAVHGVTKSPTRLSWLNQLDRTDQPTEGKNLC